MSSTDIVRGIKAQIQSKLLPATNRYWRSQLQFGLSAYGLRSFQSLTGNARMVVNKPGTAARKSERLFANTNLANQFGSIFNTLGLVKPSSYVNCDHSDMNGLTAFVGALQTRNGRAIPCLIETTYSDRLSARSDAPLRRKMLRVERTKARKAQSFTGHYIDALQDFHDRLGFWPKLVFDRGFGNYSLVTHLQAEGAIFYIRLKAGRFVELDSQKTEIKHLKHKDAVVNIYGLKLRVVRSMKNKQCFEPWYILTNDFISSRDKVVKIYYHRFEIEETFRDMKHIWELKRTRLNKPLSLKILLWFVALGIALLYTTTKHTKQTVKSCHNKKQVSWVRIAYEQLQQGYAQLLWGG